VITGPEGLLTLYALQGSDGSPHRRIMYCLPVTLPSCVLLGTTLFCGATVCPDLMPSYVPSLESQILVLVVYLHESPIFFVIDMIIFLDKAIHSDTPVMVPWSDWGPQHTCCFPLDHSHALGVFGSKLAIALPLDRTPEPGQRLEELPLSTESHFYVHIWDFNKRVIAREEKSCDHTSQIQNPIIRKPGRLASCFDSDIISNHPYIASVCRTPFPSHDFGGLSFEQDRLILKWVGALSYEYNDGLMCPHSGIFSRLILRSFPLCRQRLGLTSRTRIDYSSSG
jgi:hypothetical protein